MSATTKPLIRLARLCVVAWRWLRRWWAAHLGWVIASVVGQARYQFDIWGDTVNLTARMVGMGAPESVTATQEVWEQLQLGFRGEALGEIEVEGKGPYSGLQAGPFSVEIDDRFWH